MIVSLLALAAVGSSTPGLTVLVGGGIDTIRELVSKESLFYPWQLSIDTTSGVGGAR